MELILQDDTFRGVVVDALLSCADRKSDQQRVAVANYTR